MDFIQHYDPMEFDLVMTKVRDYFKTKGFVECYTQNRLSIMSGCEQVENISPMTYVGQTWPLPQTGQMWLEHELLKNPDLPGLFSLSTSYRNESDPVPGRHFLSFGMIEFEMKGDMEDLVKLETEFLEYLGFPNEDNINGYSMGAYEELAGKYHVSEIEHEQEMRLCEDNGPVFFLTHFPERTSPFWNIKRETANGQVTSKKVDVILSGQETIGSAERCCNVDEMRKRFLGTANGKYAKALYAMFTQERVLKELDDYFGHTFFTRSGGGIGLDRLIRAMKLNGLLRN